MEASLRMVDRRMVGTTDLSLPYPYPDPYPYPYPYAYL